MPFSLTNTNWMNVGYIFKRMSDWMTRFIHILWWLDVDKIQPINFHSLPQLTDVLVHEILHGADGTSIKCGVTGETGCSWPLTEGERRVLQATAHAEAQLGRPVIIHPGRNPTSKQVMSHLHNKLRHTLTGKQTIYQLVRTIARFMNDPINKIIRSIKH